MSSRCARMRRIVLMLFMTICCSSCFFGPSRGAKVLGYRHGQVLLTAGKRYAVGALPEGWTTWTRHANTIRFRHAASGSMIATSAYCRASFEDLPLKMLMGHWFAGIQPVTVEPAKIVSLDGRDALRERSRRVIDGVTMHYDAVVVKKNSCSFDFLLITPPTHGGAVTPAFEAFFRGFHYE